MGRGNYHASLCYHQKPCHKRHQAQPWRLQCFSKYSRFAWCPFAGNLNLPKNLSARTFSVGEAWTSFWSFLNILFSAISIGTVTLLHLHISCFQSCDTWCHEISGIAKSFIHLNPFRTLKLLKICNLLNHANTTNIYKHNWHSMPEFHCEMNDRPRNTMATIEFSNLQGSL